MDTEARQDHLPVRGAFDVPDMRELKCMAHRMCTSNPTAARYHLYRIIEESQVIGGDMLAAPDAEEKS